MFSPLVQDILGYAGGGVLSVCLIPQLVLIIQTKSADDISYAWTGLYFLGLLLTFLYLIAVDAVAGWASMVVELGAVLVMIGLKCYYNRTQKLPAPSTAPEPQVKTVEAASSSESGSDRWAIAAEAGYMARRMLAAGSPRAPRSPRAQSSPTRRLQGSPARRASTDSAARGERRNSLMGGAHLALSFTGSVQPAASRRASFQMERHGM